MTTRTTHIPSPDEIARQAYFLYQQRGCQPGHELDDWLEAEALLSTAAPKQQTSTSDHDHQLDWQPSASRAETRMAKRSKAI